MNAWRFAATEPVEVKPGDLRLAHLLVRRFETRPRVFDPVHVGMAKRLGAQLVSRDGGMRAAVEMVGVAPADPG